MVEHTPEASSVHSALRVFVIFNPVAGRSNAAVVRRALERHFAREGGNTDVHETTGRENLAELARSAAERGVDVVIAAGGDGTVSGVADGLVGSRTHLGIIPLGTTNVLARELGIPLDLDGACSLIASSHSTTAIDAMRIGDAYYYTQVGVGIDALMIRDTKTEAKRRFGKLAYIGSALMHLFGYQPRRFRLVVDGRETKRPASQIVVANSGTLGQPPFRWGPDIRPDDGRVDVCVVRAKTLFDYFELFIRVLLGRHRGSPNVRYFAARRSVRISVKKPLPVQADGEIVGETPVEIEVAPGAVRVVSPSLTLNKTL
jgi:diacylglycerol kinase (ATP)